MMKKRFAIILLFASGCTPRQSTCVLVEPTSRVVMTSCKSTEAAIMVQNSCLEELVVSAVESTTAEVAVRESFPLTVPANGSAAIAIVAQSLDGGVSSHPLTIDFRDGSRMTTSVDIEAPVRRHRRFVYELQPATDVLVATDGSFSAQEIQAHFALLLRSLSGAKFYHFHVLTESDGGVSTTTIAANSDGFEPNMNSALSRMAQLARPVDGIAGALDEIQLQSSTFPELVVFTSGSETTEQPVHVLLNRLLSEGSKPPFLWLFVRGSTCPTPLSASYQAVVDTYPYFTVYDSCLGVFDTELLAIQKNDVHQTTRWFFSGDEFRASLVIRYDDVVTNSWRTGSSPNGDYFELLPGSFTGRREYSVDYDLLTECELDGGR